MVGCRLHDGPAIRVGESLAIAVICDALIVGKKGERDAWIVGCIFATVLGTNLASAADEPVNLIKYRQATMKAIGGHMGALGAMAKGEVSFTDEAVGHAHAINAMSKNLLRLFPEGSGYEADKSTNALPAIWEKWADFEAEAKALQDESAKLVAVAESGDASALGPQVGAVGRDGCSTCHDTFRYKK